MAAVANTTSGSLSGSISSGARAPVQGAAVEVFDCYGAEVAALSTDEAGRIRLDGLAAASYTLTIAAAGFITVNLGVSVATGSVTEVAVTLWPSAGAVAGAVTDAETGRPVPGATVVILDAAEAGRSVTGPDGRFALYDLAPGGYTLRAGGDAYGLIAQGLTVAAGRQTEVALVLTPHPGGVGGAVKDAATGAPLAGASVQVYADGGLRLATARCDGEGGRYHLPPLSAGQYMLVGTADGCGHEAVGVLAVRDAEATVDLALCPFTGDLAGMVTDAGGGAVAGGVVRACDRLGVPVAAACTDKAGRYSLPGLAEDNYTLVLQAPGRQSTHLGVLVDGGAAVEADAVLRAGGGRLEGRAIAAATGAALPGAVVQAYSQDDFPVFSARTDAHGRFAAAGLADGSYKVVATAKGYATDWTGAVVVSGRTAWSELRLPDAAGAVMGGVTSAGAAVPGAMVAVFTWAGVPIATQVTDNGGRFEILGLRPGRYLLQVRSLGLAAVTSESPVFAHQTTQLNVVLHGPSAVLAGRVEAGGRPAGGAVVRVCDRAGRPLNMTLTDPEGRYMLGELPAGDAVVVASGPGLTAAANPVSLTAGRRAALDVTLRTDPARLFQLVRDARGIPQGAVHVRLLDAGGRQLFVLLTDDGGSYWLRAWSPFEQPWLVAN